MEYIVDLLEMIGTKLKERIPTWHMGGDLQQ